MDVRSAVLWQRKIVVWTVAFGALLAAGCGDETSRAEPAPTVEPCQAGGRVTGIAGRVAAPSCETVVGFAEITLFDQLMFERATTVADEAGEFAFTVDQVGGDDLYLIRAVKGSFSGRTEAPFELSGGESDFQVVRMNQ